MMSPGDTPEDGCSRVYLLYVWQERVGAPWRAALRAAGTDLRVPFADLEQLALFLLALPDQIDRAGEHGVTTHP